MEDGDIRVVPASNYAYHYFMYHAHGHLGTITFVLGLIMTLGFIGAMFYALFLCPVTPPADQTLYFLTAAMFGICAFTLILINRKISHQASLFAYDAVQCSNNFTPEDIRTFYDNYPK